MNHVHAMTVDVTQEVAVESVARALEEIVRARALATMARSVHLTFADAVEMALEKMVHEAELQEDWYALDIVRRRMGLGAAEVRS